MPPRWSAPWACSPGRSVRSSSSARAPPMRGRRKRSAPSSSRPAFPFLPMSMAKGLLPDEHPLSAAAARSFVLKEADVVMLVGARLNWLLGHGKPPQWAADVQFVQLDHPGHRDGQQPPIAAPVVGDIESSMAALLAELAAGRCRAAAPGSTRSPGARKRTPSTWRSASPRSPIRWSSTARSAPSAACSRAGPTSTWSMKAPTRSISPATSSTCRCRACGWTPAPGA